MDNTKNLENLEIIKKTAAGGPLRATGALTADLLSRGGLGALALLSLAPIATGAGIGYGTQKLKRPSDEKFENLSKEMLLAEINKQTSQMNRLKNLQDLRQGSNESEVESAEKAEREIHA